MSNDAERELELIVNQLSASQREALVKLFGDEYAPREKRTRRVLASEKTEDSKVTIKCRLCGTSYVHVFKSCSSTYSVHEVKTCGQCEFTLRDKSKEELIEIVLNYIDPEGVKLRGLKTSIQYKAAEATKLEMEEDEYESNKGDEGNSSSITSVDSSRDIDTTI